MELRQFLLRWLTRQLHRRNGTANALKTFAKTLNTIEKLMNSEHEQRRYPESRRLQNTTGSAPAASAQVWQEQLTAPGRDDVWVTEGEFASLPLFERMADPCAGADAQRFRELAQELDFFREKFALCLGSILAKLANAAKARFSLSACLMGFNSRYCIAELWKAVALGEVGLPPRGGLPLLAVPSRHLPQPVHFQTLFGDWELPQATVVRLKSV